MTTEFAIGIDFGTTKSLLSYTPRNTEIGVPPQFATFKEQLHLAPTNNDAPYNREGAGMVVQPVPTFISIDLTKSNARTAHLIPGFRAVDPKMKKSPGLEIVGNLKQLAASTGDDRFISKHKYPIEGLVANYLWSLRKHAKELEKIPMDKQGVTITVPAKAGIVQRMTTQFAAAVAGFKGV